MRVQLGIVHSIPINEVMWDCGICVTPAFDQLLQAALTKAQVRGENAYDENREVRRKNAVRKFREDEGENVCVIL